MTRRRLLGQGAMAAGAVALQPLASASMQHHVATNAAALNLEPFVDPLFLPVKAVSVARRESAVHGVTSAPYHRIVMQENFCRIHRDLPPTRVWSYGGGPVGPLLEAKRNEGVLIEWVNRLPHRHFLPIDYTLHGSGRDVPESRAIVHLHGGRTPADSDGYPELWYPSGQSRTFFYPNSQDAATLWYHDHAMGISRLNLYAGLMGMYLLRDEQEAKLNLPSGAYELPLLLRDCLLDGKGQLFYPVSEDSAHPWVDTFEGDVMLVNGRVQPFHEVEPRRYRLRIVNAANSRFFLLSLSNGQDFHQIGSDQGLLAATVTLERLLLAPGERADAIVDFAGHAGENVELRNGAFAIMQFRVSKQSHAEDSSTLPVELRAVPRVSEASAIRRREMTLNEFDDPTGQSMVMLLNRTAWHMPVTEKAALNSTEIWSLVNLTDDTHPIHLHHVRFQILDRRHFDRDEYLLNHGHLRYLAEAASPRPEEMGWKDVVQCPPNLVTRILIMFGGYPGRYAWHCHLQEHEANDMMRPYEIVA